MPDPRLNNHDTACDKRRHNVPPEVFERIANSLDGSRGSDQMRIAEVGLLWIDTILRKNADYGGSAWREPVLAPGCPVDSAIRVRMSDKIERIRSLVECSSGGEVGGKAGGEVGESMEDTISDLGSYCLLWLARPKPELYRDLSDAD